MRDGERVTFAGIDRVLTARFGEMGTRHAERVREFYRMEDPPIPGHTCSDPFAVHYPEHAYASGFSGIYTDAAVSVLRGAFGVDACIHPEDYRDA